MQGLQPDEIDALLRALQQSAVGRSAAQGGAEDGAPPDATPTRRASSRLTATGVRVEDLDVDVSVYVGGGEYPLSELAGWRPGSVVTLHTEVGEPAILAVEGRVVALGEIVVTRDDMLAVRVTRPVLGADAADFTPAWLIQPHRTAAGPGPHRAAGAGPAPAADA